MSSRPSVERPLERRPEDLEAARRIESTFRALKPWTRSTLAVTTRPIGPQTGRHSFEDNACLSEREAVVVFGRLHGESDEAGDVVGWISKVLRSPAPRRTAASAPTEFLVRNCRTIHAQLRERNLSCSLFYGFIDARLRRLDYVSAGPDSRVVLLRDGKWIPLEQTSHLLGGPVESLGRFQSVTLGSLPLCFLVTGGTGALPAWPASAAIRTAFTSPDMMFASLNAQADLLATGIDRHSGPGCLPPDSSLWGVAFAEIPWWNSADNVDVEPRPATEKFASECSPIYYG